MDMNTMYRSLLLNTNGVNKFAHKIGKTLYLVESSSSRKATDTIENKVKQLILRECNRNSK